MNDAHILPNWLAHRAAVLPNQPALLADGARWTFAALDRWVSDMARNLLMRVAPQDRVALLLRNRPEFVALAHAAPRAGITLVPLNTRLSAPELAWQIADSGARLLFYAADTAALAEAAIAVVPSIPLAQADDQPQLLRRDFNRRQLVAVEIARLDDTRVPNAALRTTIDLAEPYTIIYTSGTTGQPKGALLTYGNYWWSAVGSALNLGSHADDRWLAVLPLFHVGGMSILMRAAIYGIPAVLHSAFDPAAVNRAIDEDGVTIISVVSTMLQRMLEERGDRPYPAALRCVLLGGVPAPQPLLEACAARGVPVVQTYGLTETASQVATLAPADALRKLGSAGQPLLPTALRIASAGIGEVGEILVRGPTVMRGYINRPDQTAQALRDGWLYTGDLGELDTDGYLYIRDRKKDMVLVSGFNVYPREVEEVLCLHPAVLEAAVIGIGDEQRGALIKAFVALRPGADATAETLDAHCRLNLAPYKVPRVYVFLDRLPKTTVGKTDKKQLN